MENIRKTDYLGQLTSMINKAKKELSAYVEIVDVAIASGSKGSKIGLMSSFRTLFFTHFIFPYLNLFQFLYL